MDWKKRSKGRPRICPVTQKKLIELREEGWTYRAIATKLNICQMTVFRYYDKHRKSKESKNSN